MSATTSTERADALDQLRALFPPGSTARTILRHVSRSGMTRAISVVAEGEDVSWLLARAGIGRVNQTHGGITVGGCGMDMGFSLVYNMSYALYPDGFGCTGEDAYRDGDNGERVRPCPSSDHNNGDRDYTPGRVHERDGGYAVSQRWL